MKNIAYFLLVAGFLYGSYIAALDESVVDWGLFTVAALLAIAGVVLAKRIAAAEAQSGEVLETNRNELRESLANIVRDLDQLTSSEIPQRETLRNWIDTTLRNDLRRFAEARESMVHLYSLQTYADIMSEFAAGERYINRVWSAAADDYDEEAERYVHRAKEQFRKAQSDLAEAASQAA
ncbi:MAG: hypothetical protein P8X81_11595 [Woeseiaceae bacterium]|jgi:hypothetical protein